MISNHDIFLWDVSMEAGFRKDQIVLRNKIRGSNKGKTHLFNLIIQILSILSSCLSWSDPCKRPRSAFYHIMTCIMSL